METKILFEMKTLRDLVLGESLTLPDEAGSITRFPRGYVWTQYCLVEDRPAITSVFIPIE